jgi:hypothetical protein
MRDRIKEHLDEMEDTWRFVKIVLNTIGICMLVFIPIMIIVLK